MARAKYYYNVKTLRYERVPFSWAKVFSVVTGIATFSALLFVAFFYLQNKIIDTRAEKDLRAENSALREHHQVVTARLTESEDNLNTLLDKETGLQVTFFDDARQSTTLTNRQDANAILTAERPQFLQVMSELRASLATSLSKASISNNHFADYASVERADLEQVSKFPGAAPIANLQPMSVVSGFGTRINPWHKAKFHHDGVDFSAARGTNIMATGNGTVTLVKNSELQAGFGNYLEIDHGYGYVTRYTHLGEIKVRMGQRVTKGLTIAVMGMSGGSIAPHVHYEVLKDGHQIDPMKVLVEGMNADLYHQLAVAASQPNQSLD